MSEKHEFQPTLTRRPFECDRCGRPDSDPIHRVERGADVEAAVRVASQSQTKTA